MIPTYYPAHLRQKVWLKLSDFKQIERDWLFRSLEPAAQPGKLPALGVQTNPLLVREREEPRIWWVNQGASYNRARAGEYLWAPIKDKTGRRLPHWDAMKYLRVGDVVLHYANTRIRAVGRVVDAAKPSPRPAPEADQAWGDEGRRAEVESRDIEPPVDLADIPQDWRRKERGVFNVDGGVSQGYLFALSDEFAKKLDDQFPQLQLRDEVDFQMVTRLGSVPSVGQFDLATLRAAAVDRGLILEDQIYAAVLAALDSGKHVILTGPPGTAKTTVAELVAEIAAMAGRCEGHVLTTATADWTTYETIGGLKPDPQRGLSFVPGHFLEAIEKNQWLVIDELNRSNFDRAFGQLFTVLSGQSVELPYERSEESGRLVLRPEDSPPRAVEADELLIPRTWRVIATMNVFDKSLLFEMSFALMRRFAFIEIPAPPEVVFHALIDRAASPDLEAAELAKKHLILRQFKDLGPAVFMDLARFFRARREVSEVSDGDLSFEGFYGFLLPQFEGIDMAVGEELYRESRRLVGNELAERLRLTLNAVLGLELASQASIVEEEIAYESFSPDEDL